MIGRKAKALRRAENLRRDITENQAGMFLEGRILLTRWTLRQPADRFGKRSTLMSTKTAAHSHEKRSGGTRKAQRAHHALSYRIERPNAASALARAVNAPAGMLAPVDILALQRAAGNRVVQRMLNSLLSNPEIIQRKENKTGLPDNLKSGIENLSGIAMDDVKVHYNSSKPAQVQALAYTLGTDIYLAPGQEEHLPHEAWHVVQQKQGIVKPTLQMKGVAINDDRGLERQADVMGEKATRLGLVPPQRQQAGDSGISQPVKLNLHAHSEVKVAQRRNVGEVPEANTTITRAYGFTNHGHSNAEIRAAIIAGWAAKRDRVGGGYYVSWGEGAPEGVIFHDNGNSLTVIHAQSGENIREQRRIREAAYAARRAAGGGAASTS